MNTFLKVLSVGILVAVLLHFWPVILATSLLLGLAAVIVAACGTGGVSVLVGLGLAILGLVAGVIALGMVVLSPLWLPIVAIIGLVALIRSSRGSRLA